MSFKHFAIPTSIATVGLIWSVAWAQTNDHGLDPKNIDTTVSPCENFYQYANGTWLKNNPIPPQYANWGVANEINERNNTLLHKILEDAAGDKKAAPGSNRQKIGDFYAAAMDSAKIEAEGAAPLKPYLDRIAAISDVKGLEKVLAQFQAEGTGLLFRVSVEADLLISSKVIVYATQGGLGLPDRDYYLRTDPESQKIRDQYLEHVAKMLQLVGEQEADAKSAAQSIMAIETRLAKVSLTRVERRDPKADYNPITVKAADGLTPNFGWTEFFGTFGLPQLDGFSYAHPKFFSEMNQMLTEVH